VCFRDSEGIYVIQDAPLISGHVAEQLWCGYRDDIKRCIATTFNDVVQFLCLGGVPYAVYYNSDAGHFCMSLALVVSIGIRRIFSPYFLQWVSKKEFIEIVL
jgi:hypothetical protein